MSIDISRQSQYLRGFTQAHTHAHAPANAAAPEACGVSVYRSLKLGFKHVNVGADPSVSRRGLDIQQDIGIEGRGERCRCTGGSVERGTDRGWIPQLLVRWWWL